MIVRWGLDELAPLLEELGLERPLLVTSARFAELEVPVANRFAGVRRHAPVEVVAAVTEAASRSDGLVAVGGGSAIDTSKAVSAATGLRVVAVPTTYSGSTRHAARRRAARAPTRSPSSMSPHSRSTSLARRRSAPR